MRPPTPDEVRAARAAAGLSQREAAELIYRPRRAFEKWEQGARPMDPALFELFQLKAGRRAKQERPRLRRVELTSEQMTLLKWAALLTARWYVKYGGEELAHRVTEYRELEAYLDGQAPAPASDSTTTKETP